MNAQTLLEQRLTDSESRVGNNPYSAEIVRGVVAKWTDINTALTDYSQGWTIERMPAVDRAILRMGAWEVLYNDEIPDAVAISEAVALATDLSTDESPSFVNGLLGRLAEVKATIV
ncbi:hypothetical protein GCM10027053_37210 [Intrasporangium mesophilum]